MYQLIGLNKIMLCLMVYINKIKYIMYNKEIDNSIIEYINKYKNIHKIFQPTKVLSEEQILYIKNRFNDTSDLKENIYRLLNNIENVPLCPVCKKEKRKWNGSSYNKYCSKKCSALENSAFKDTEKYEILFIINMVCIIFRL